MIEAAFLYDTIEDTNMSYENLFDIFGKKTADLVLELTLDKKPLRNIKTDRLV